MRKNAKEKIAKNKSTTEFHLKENKLTNIDINNINNKRIINKGSQKLIKLKKGNSNLHLTNSNIIPSFKSYLYNIKLYKKNPQLKTNINKNINKFKIGNEYMIKDKFNVPLLSRNNMLYNSFDSYYNKCLNSNNVNYIKNSKTIDYDSNKANFLFEKNYFKNKKILKWNKGNSLSSPNSINDSNTFITSSPKINGSSKTFKDSEFLSSISLENFEKKLKKKLKKNYSSLNGKELLYEEKYRYAVLDPINILNYFERKKQAKLFEEEKSLTNFVNTNKEILKKNIMINLVKSELNIINNKESIEINFIKKKKNETRKNVFDFEYYKNDQKKMCRKIDRYLFNILKENRALIEQEYNINYDMNVIRKNIRKLLVDINDYRLYGKFINEALGGDTSRFDKKIFPKISDKELNFNYDLLAKETIFNYKCFLNENNEFEKDEKFIKENEFINDPNILYEKIIEMKDYFLLYIENKKNIEDDITNIQKLNYKKEKYLQDRYIELKKEYDSLIDRSQKEINQINKLKKEKSKKRNELYDIIIDLYYYINSIIFRKKEAKKDENILDYIEDINKNISEMYNILEELLMNLNNYEENDNTIFQDVVIKRKNEIKQYKKNLALQRFINKNIDKKENTCQNRDKILFVSRKTEAPYKKPKKIKKKVVLNEKEIENIENYELINYNS